MSRIFILFTLLARVDLLLAAAVTLPADFLNLLLLQRGQQPSDPCYDEFDKPRHCKPDFVNAALGRPVVASSECGGQSRGPETFCRLSSAGSSNQAGSLVDFVNEKVPDPTNSQQDLDVNGDQFGHHDASSSSINRSCYLCDERQPRTSHSADLVTDVNDPRNATCWVSSLLPYETSRNRSSSGGATTNNNVTLTLSLGKRFEITYVSVTFCQEEPTAFSIWKSDDYGATWQPFRMYSRDCRSNYNVEPGESISTTSSKSPTPRTRTTTTTTTQAPLVAGRHSRRQTRRMTPAPVDAFGSIDNTENNDDNDDGDDSDFTSPTPGLAPTCIEEYGSTATGHSGLPPIPGANRLSLSESRVVFPTLELAPPTVSLDDLDTSPELQNWVSATDLRIEFSRLPAHYSAASIAETRYFSVADLAVGGRCRCNGHASRCVGVPGAPQRLQCECRHNTQGEDCGQCKPFFVDRPWRRATANEANECVACNCNLHARQCRFNEELWQLSGQRSGGVCVGCRHNTAGRNCQYCREGFFRDHTKPITHRRACKVCECHPVGSLGRTCNQTTGQCPCKEGVEGISCSRCAAGYQQTNSPVQPCVKIVQTFAVEPNVPEVSDYQADDPYVDVTPQPPVRSAVVHYPGYGPKHHQQRAHAVHQTSAAPSSCDVVCSSGSGRTSANGPRLTFSKWCQSHFAALIQLEDGGRLRVGSWTRLTARLYRVFARNQVDNGDGEEDDDEDEDDEAADDQPTLPSGDEISVWIQTRVLDCKCFKLREGKKWLVTGRLGRVMAPAPSGGGRAGRSATPVAQFILEPATSAVVKWKPELETRLKKFARMDRSGACNGHETAAVQPTTVAERRHPSTAAPTAPPPPQIDNNGGYDEEMADDQQPDEAAVDATNDDYNDAGEPDLMPPPQQPPNSGGQGISVMPSVSRRSPVFDAAGANGGMVYHNNNRRMSSFHQQSQRHRHRAAVSTSSVHTAKRRDRQFDHNNANAYA